MSAVVIAPDSFKGTLSARDAAEALASGWREVRPDDELRLVPMADGGEGTIDAFETAVAGATRMPVVVHGPDGRDVETSWLWLPPVTVSPPRGAPPALAGRLGGTGVVELASTSGITLLDELRPLDAHTIGFGEAIAAALDAGVDRLLLALGSSCSTDGGAGALVALGAVLQDSAGRSVPAGGRGLGSIARLDLSALRSLPPQGAVILSDVTNPLLGATGAAAVFAPQKGADDATVATLDDNLARWSRLVEGSGAPGDPDAPGAGAAGGTGFGLLAWGATVAAGSLALAEALGLREALVGASFAITGEGRFDSQSLNGKVPAAVLELAEEHHVPVALVAGLVTAATDPFSDSLALVALAGSADAALAEPARWLRVAGRVLADGFGRT